MTKKQPLIFVSNDDGYQASGLKQLLEMLRPLGARILVMAPEGPRSGYSMAMTSQTPVTCSLISQVGEITVYRCSGTPVDCVKLAFHTLFAEEKPDLVLSGINHGDNASVNAHYSGTMGVVIEGCLKGIPSLAFSSCETSSAADFCSYTQVVQNLVRYVLKAGLPERVCLNVNFPETSAYKGVRICRQDRGQWHQEWRLDESEDGCAYYWLSGYYASVEPWAEETDRWALEHDYVAITPTTVDLTAYAYLDELKKVKDEILSDRG